MSWWIEIMCDKGRISAPTCLSFNNEGPGRTATNSLASIQKTVTEVIAEAYRQGWMRDGNRGGWICPKCRKEPRKCRPSSSSRRSRSSSRSPEKS